MCALYNNKSNLVMFIMENIFATVHNIQKDNECTIKYT